MIALEYGPPNPRVASILAGDNRDLMHHIEPIYLRRGNRRLKILDLTWGSGGWWDEDLRPSATFEGDYTSPPLPFETNSFPVVAYDPAYVAVGSKDKSTLPGHFERYGLDKVPKGVERLVLEMEIGQREAARISRGIVLQKCQQQVEGAKFHDLPTRMKESAARCGLVLIDEIIHVRGLTAQPIRNNDGSLRQWDRAHRAHSHLLVFAASRTSGVPEAPRFNI